MKDAGAILPGPGSDKVPVDTGVVILCGQALTGFISLLSDSTLSLCTSRTLSALSPQEEAGVLRFELYSDILQAMALKDQNRFDFPVFLDRLGVKQEDFSPSSSLYHRALRVIWDTFCKCPLHLIHVQSGEFTHLGTSKEVISLLTVPSAEGITIFQSTQGLTDKLRNFAVKYNINKFIRSRIFSDNSNCNLSFSFIVINSLFYSDSIFPLHNERISISEHSMLFGSFALNHHSVVSHVNSILGNNLIVNSHILMQQVHLKSASNCALIVLNSNDDVKRVYHLPDSVVFGVSWQVLFSIGAVNAEDIWPIEISPSERSLWNARLFPEFRSVLDFENSYIEVKSQESEEFIQTSRLCLTWLQDLEILSR
jgi:hypothetical protein